MIAKIISAYRDLKKRRKALAVKEALDANISYYTAHCKQFNIEPHRPWLGTEMFIEDLIDNIEELCKL